MKIYCADCGEDRDFANFYIQKSTRRPRTYCKYHTLARNRKYRTLNRQTLNIKKNEYRRCVGRPTQRKQDLWKRFGITLEDYEQLLKRQNGGCAICEQPETAKHKTGKTRRLAVDHCHKTNKIRGLLCNRCNIGIGRFLDNSELLRKAAEYVRK